MDFTGSVHQGTISTAIFLAFLDLTPDIFRLKMGASNLDMEKVINNIQSLLTPLHENHEMVILINYKLVSLCLGRSWMIICPIPW